MSETIVVALISLAGTLVGSLLGVTATARLTTYRLEQLLMILTISRPISHEIRCFVIVSVLEILYLEVQILIIDIFNTDKKYNIIYADPPWQYNDRGVPGGAEQHYSTMTIEDIKSLPVEKLASDNCILFIWVTFPLLQEGLDTIKAWGFEYKTIGFNWVKHNKNSLSWFLGIGNYTRSNPELCLIATRGERLPRQDMGICSVVDTPVERHSKKPDIIRRQIVQLMGDLPRIELFARQEHKGWDCFGDEV